MRKALIPFPISVEPDETARPHYQYGLLHVDWDVKKVLVMLLVSNVGPKQTPQIYRLFWVITGRKRKGPFAHKLAQVNKKTSKQFIIPKLCENDIHAKLNYSFDIVVKP